MSLISQGVLPLSGLSLQIVSMDSDASNSQYMFQISSESLQMTLLIQYNTLSCNVMCRPSSLLSSRSNGGVQGVQVPKCCWVTEVDAAHRRQETQVNISAHESLSLCSLLPSNYLPRICYCCTCCSAVVNRSVYLFLPQLPCDEHWKKEELKKYLLQAPIWQWEGSPIQHMGQPGYISMVHISNRQVIWSFTVLYQLFISSFLVQLKFVEEQRQSQGVITFLGIACH